MCFDFIPFFVLASLKQLKRVTSKTITKKVCKTAFTFAFFVYFHTIVRPLIFSIKKKKILRHSQPFYVSKFSHTDFCVFKTINSVKTMGKFPHLKSKKTVGTGKKKLKQNLAEKWKGKKRRKWAESDKNKKIRIEKESKKQKPVILLNNCSLLMFSSFFRWFFLMTCRWRFCGEKPPVIQKAELPVEKGRFRLRKRDDISEGHFMVQCCKQRMKRMADVFLLFFNVCVCIFLAWVK